eukprot:TRINITY_DN18850_c0_g1_i1.p1 TRINITY_DN18850_c0_g1~~TRINITY_DN18850_c0_g1_i1.p1  ORF type:complete len:753 (+),score=136.07 TRINITY_DN18850_c0_g1_i1:93-2351(+)
MRRGKKAVMMLDIHKPRMRLAAGEDRYEGLRAAAAERIRNADPAVSDPALATRPPVPLRATESASCTAWGSGQRIAQLSAEVATLQGMVACCCAQLERASADRAEHRGHAAALLQDLQRAIRIIRPLASTPAVSVEDRAPARSELRSEVGDEVRANAGAGSREEPAAPADSPCDAVSPTAGGDLLQCQPAAAARCLGVLGDTAASAAAPAKVPAVSPATPPPRPEPARVLSLPRIGTNVACAQQPGPGLELRAAFSPPRTVAAGAVPTPPRPPPRRAAGLAVTLCSVFRFQRLTQRVAAALAAAADARSLSRCYIQWRTLTAARSQHRPADVAPCLWCDRTLLSRLGDGGEAQVWAACGFAMPKATDADADVALKVFKTPDGGEVEGVHERLRSSGHCWVKHVSLVVSSYHIACCGGGHYVQEFERADSDLFAYVTDRGPLDATLALLIHRDMLRGLAAIHSVGALHGDVKPENVLCTSTDGALSVALCDLVDQGNACTPLWMPPSGEWANDGTDDVYAAVLVLLSMLTAAKPPAEGQRDCAGINDFLDGICVEQGTEELGEEFKEAFARYAADVLGRDVSNRADTSCALSALTIFTPLCEEVGVDLAGPILLGNYASPAYQSGGPGSGSERFHSGVESGSGDDGDAGGREDAGDGSDSESGAGEERDSADGGTTGEHSWAPAACAGSDGSTCDPDPARQAPAGEGVPAFAAECTETAAQLAGGGAFPDPWADALDATERSAASPRLLYGGQ